MRLKAITFNIWNYNNFDERKHKIIEFLRSEDADIVALQEIRDDARYNVEGEHQAKQLNDALKYPHMTFVETMDLNEIDQTPLLPKRTEGLALLSKHPIIHAKAHELVRHPDDKFTRKLLHCRVQAKSVIDVFVVHFSPHVFYSELQLIDTIRFMQKHHLEPIILGDFNIYRQDIVRQHAPMMKSSSEHTQYVSYPGRSWTLDYVLLPQQWRFLSVQASGDELSDHRAVMVEISDGLE